VGLALVDALRRSPGAEALAADDLDRVLQSYPAEVRKAARPLRERLAAAYLGELTSQLAKTPGDAERGKEVFFSRKAACYGCHRAAGKGGSVGPDLSQVGRFRTPGDLLESIVFPSSSIVPEFRAFVVHTRDGRVTAGTIVRETSDAVFLRTAQLAEVRLARADVEEMTPSPTSIMPEGLEKTMSRQELSDLLEFLSRQR
jgi:putative heme-binding domain-containing protein